jgi:hypothetical protein
MNNSTYWYRNCSVEFNPEQENVRRESKLTVPNRNEETLVTSIQYDFSKDIAIRHKPEIKGGLKALKEKGLKITDYKENIPKKKKLG